MDGLPEALLQGAQYGVDADRVVGEHLGCQRAQLDAAAITPLAVGRGVALLDQGGQDAVGGGLGDAGAFRDVAQPVRPVGAGHRVQHS
jgi:hypothetical protein